MVTKHERFAKYNWSNNYNNALLSCSKATEDKIVGD
ncbi:MAG: hypothetical protein JWP13_976 [Candidatus Saccharibacteria bacterium]|nr:hypothetical protein [Candidatus Saccharibacteria bacterium]